MAIAGIRIGHAGSDHPLWFLVLNLEAHISFNELFDQQDFLKYTYSAWKINAYIDFFLPSV
jgi:hypothetical protein